MDFWYFLDFCILVFAGLLYFANFGFWDYFCILGCYKTGFCRFCFGFVFLFWVFLYGFGFVCGCLICWDALLVGGCCFLWIFDLAFACCLWCCILLLFVCFALLVGIDCVSLIVLFIASVFAFCGLVWWVLGFDWVYVLDLFCLC